ncbi:hypothetical protein IC619_000300 [Hazenella sp. IB182353]|uniref:hypothetical protein n=1 Tax=Polycladospora coralii TaxID=2771432 RepID=UPI00174744DA|nr:hypothetical protein [Polycladospora coralii]MBS7528931.1 hypothetical protein [Polycladospora coralii]
MKIKLVMKFISLLLVFGLLIPVPTQVHADIEEWSRTSDSTYIWETVSPGDSFISSFSSDLIFQSNVDMVIYDYDTEAVLDYEPEMLQVEFINNTNDGILPTYMNFSDALALGYPVEWALSPLFSKAIKFVDTDNLSSTGEVRVRITNTGSKTIGVEGYLYGLLSP